MALTDLKVTPIEYDLSNPAFSDEKAKNKILSLLPSTKREKLSFYLTNVNVGIANGIRRTIQGELKIKSLICEIADIKTTEDFIIMSELIDRIRLIPINQDIPLDAEFAVNIVNNNINKDEMIIKSSDIKQIKGEKPGYLFPETIRLARLTPGKTLLISKIKVVEGYGYEHGCFCLTNNVEYNIIDFINVNSLNKKGNFVYKRVNVDDLSKLLTKNKITHDKMLLYTKKILLIPNKTYLHMISDDKLKRFDHVLKSEEDVVDEDKFIKNYQSAELQARNFHLSFITNGNIDAKKIVKMACDNIVDRLETIKNVIIEMSNNADVKNDTISIIADNIKTSVIIREEDYTIAEIIKKCIYEIEPGIGLINSTMEHVFNRTIILNIIHTDPIGILLEGIEYAQDLLQKLKK